jgi:hypothetical protein
MVITTPSVAGDIRRLEFLEILMDAKGHRFKELQEKVGNTMTDKISKEFKKKDFIIIEQGNYQITKKGIDEYHILNTLEKQRHIKNKDAVAINQNNIHFTTSTNIPINQKEEFTERFLKWTQEGEKIFSEFGLPCGSVMGVYTKSKVASLQENGRD